MEPIVNEKKGFWSKPEGVTGMLMLGAGVVAIVYFSGVIIPFLIGLAANLITLSIMLAVLGTIAYFALDPKFRKGVFYLFKSISRFFTSWVITIDPIGRAKEYIAELKIRLRKVEENIDIVAGEQRKMKTLIENNITKMKDFKYKHEHLTKNNGSKAQLQTIASMMGNIHNQNSRYIPIYDKITKTLDVLNHTLENTGAYVEQLEFDVKSREEEYKVIKSANSALKSAFSIFSGGDVEREMFDESMEYVLNDMSLKMGEMDQILRTSEGFLNAGDLEKQVTAEKGADIISNFDPSKIEILSLDEIRSARENPTSGVVTKTSSKYDF